MKETVPAFTLLQPVAKLRRNWRREIGREHMHVKGTLQPFQ